MKRTVVILSLIFALAIALSVSVPAIAAPDPDDTVQITGSVTAAITVSVTEASIALSGAIVPDEDAVTAGTNVNIKSNRDWKLAVQASDDGHMVSGATPLANEMTFTGGTLTGVDLSGSDQTFSTGTKSTDGDKAWSVSQLGDWEDAVGSYTITLTFTGSANP